MVMVVIVMKDPLYNGMFHQQQSSRPATEAVA